MHSWIELSRSALLGNYRGFCQVMGKERVAPVLKSNAYGHGMPEVFGILRDENPEWLCVNYLFEAKELRELGFAKRILVVGPLLAEELVDAFNLEADILLPSTFLLEHWLGLANKPRAHIKIDTGMSRQGFLIEDMDRIVAMLQPACDRVVGVCTHFANVEDVLEHGYADLQMDRFQKARDKLAAGGMDRLITHAASSASSLILADSRFDLCRIGISLYGVWPSQTTRLSYSREFGEVIGLKPVLAWKTRVALAKPVEQGSFIGYGCTYRAPYRMIVAVLPVGYYEGYPRLAGNDQSYVLIRGSRCRIVGRICMNMLMVDVTHVKGVEAQDEVALIGVDGDDSVSASDMAHWSQTIHYELLTRLNPLIPRRVVA